MLISDFLRCQAEHCLRIARAGFDLDTAEKLRHMASELRGKAEELDRLARPLNCSLPRMEGAGWAYEPQRVTVHVQQQQQPQTVGVKRD